MCFKKLKSLFKKTRTASSEPVKGDEDVNIENNEFESPLKHLDMDSGNYRSKDSRNEMPPEFEYLKALIVFRLNRYFHPDRNGKEPEIPDLNDWYLPISDFILNNK